MKKSVKILCLVMTIAMTLTSLPITAFALPLSSNEKVSYETNDISQYISEDVYVMAEATEKRGEFEKHYILSDGSMVAVSYPEAVHFINESGKWEDVDNTFSYDYKSKRYVGGKGNTKFSFTESVSSGALVAIKDKHGTMEWSLGIIRNNKAEKGELSSTKAKVGEKTISEKATYSLNETETFDLPKTVGRIQYDTLFTNSPEISVDYSVYHNKIEEDIYINSPTDLTSFTMDVQIGDLCGIVNKNGSVEFKNEAGEVIYRIGVPYMHDSADSVLNDITVTLDQTGDTCTVTYTPNSEWLKSEDRAYPILFDPSITTSEYNSNITDTYVMQGDSANHSSQQTMYVGVKSGYTCRTYIKIGTLPAIDPSMPILSATMTLSLWAGTTTGRTVSIYRADSAWEADTITYANQPEMTQLDTCTFNAADLHYTFDLSNDVSAVYDEFMAGINYGYVLRYTDESKTDPDYNSIYSSEYTTKSCRPVLKVVYGYSLPSNLQSGNTYSLQNSGSLSFASVCNGTDANGTNVIQNNNYIDDITVNQQFKLEYVSSTGGYIFRALCSSNGSNRVLDIAKSNGYVEDGCNVQIYQNNDPIAQEWLIVGVDYLKFKIIPRTNMNLALSVYPSDGNGTSSGTTSSSVGNVFVSTFVEDNDYQYWYIIENGEYVDYDGGTAIQNATYYINNKYYGQYMYNNSSSTVYATSGKVASLGNTIKWKITFVGNGYCTIQPAGDLTKYLGRTTTYAIGYITCNDASNIPESCLWTVERADGGGVHFSFVYNSTTYYLSQNASVRIVAAGGKSSSSTWRIASTEYFSQFSELSEATLPDVNILVGDTYTIKKVDVWPNNSIWSSVNDFEWNSLNSNRATIEGSGVIHGISSGTANIQFKHKVSGTIGVVSIIVKEQLMEYDSLITDTNTRNAIIIVNRLINDTINQYNSGKITQSYKNNVINSLELQLNILRADYIITDNNYQSAFAYSVFGTTPSEASAYPFPRALSFNSVSPMTGLDVIVVQRLLELYGCCEEYSITYGVYDEETHKAAESMDGLVVDGEISEQSFGVLFFDVLERAKDKIDNLNVFRIVHDEVARRTAAKVNGTYKRKDNGIKNGGPSGNHYGYADVLLKMVDHTFVWEVKHDSSVQIANAVEQLDRYIEAADEYSSEQKFPTPLVYGYDLSSPYSFKYWGKVIEVYKPSLSTLEQKYKNAIVLYEITDENNKRYEYEDIPVVVPPPIPSNEHDMEETIGINTGMGGGEIVEIFEDAAGELIACIRDSEGNLIFIALIFVFLLVGSMLALA